jgi:transcriptional antiterminator RfaH
MPWYVVHTKPSQEERVAFHLSQKGIATYSPRTQGYVYKGLKKFGRVKPLFPNYLFAWCEKANVAQLCWTTGVKKVLWENSAPQPVPESLVAAIKTFEQEDGLIRRPASYNSNDLVMIKAGPFKDLYALFDHWESDTERVCVLLRLLNAQIKVSVPAALVGAA